MTVNALLISTVLLNVLGLLAVNVPLTTTLLNVDVLFTSKFCSMVTSLFGTKTIPVPFASNSKFAFDTIVLITLFSILILPIVMSSVEYVISFVVVL